MHNPIAPKIAKWPFFFGDALLFGLAYFIYFQSRTPMGKWEILAYILCVVLGAGFGVLPFLLEHRTTARLAEADALASVVAQIQNLERLGAEIGNATAQWQAVQEQAGKTSTAAKEIAERMTAEAKAFTEFMQKMNDSEKASLRLEAEKFRRGEAEWLQVLVRMLDHVYALYQAATRSGQQELIQQLGSFQNACRDAARRVGLAPFAASHAEIFDEQHHQIVDGETKPMAGATIDETIAAGYTFQGKLLRPALVRLQKTKLPGASFEDSADAQPVVESETEPGQLPL